MIFLSLLGVFLCSSAIAGESKKIVFIAGTKSHGPGHHEYERGLRLLARCLEGSPNVARVRTEIHTDGWPDDDRTLDDAATIVLYCDGSDHGVENHPLLRPERLARFDELMRRGVGIVMLHYTVFAPKDLAGERFLDWVGGYFDYETGSGKPPWFSRIATHKLPVEFATPAHPISRGLERYELEEEFYYNIRFREPDPRRTPILLAPIPGEAKPQEVAWAVERADGGRGFGFTGGHFHANWGVEPFRRMVLNAILWTAHGDVPDKGVQSQVAEDDLKIDAPSAAASPAEPPIKVLIVTGHQHPAHDWRATTRALEDILGADRRYDIATIVDPEQLSTAALADYRVVILNYVNWERPTLGDAARRALFDYVDQGGGLAVIHFANGAFLDWPDYRRLVRRVWIEGQSGHDAYGPFHLDITDAEHPISKGLAGFDTADELYFKQVGEVPIEPLATARSNVTGQAEPMAFAYDVGKGRVFQTVLGHDAPAIRNPGASELIRRGITWSARREIRAVPAASTSPLVPGRFGKAFDASAVRIAAATKAEYEQPPLTVECWAQLRSKGTYNLLVAHAPKESNTHWELYTRHGTGGISAYVPGYEPSVIETGHDVVDDAWHHLAMVFEPERLRLFVDGKQVTDVALKRAGGQRIAGPLWFGAYPPGGLGCDGLIDDVRLTWAAIDISSAPSEPHPLEKNTIGLWRFDELTDRRVIDVSPLGNAATLDPPADDPAAADGSISRPADADLKVVRLDRSPHESFLSLRCDQQGRLFVGGREALFVYEPAPSGGYLPRRELYRFPPHSWITDIEIRGDDLYVMTTTAIYRMPGARVRRQDLPIEKLIWGWPVDLHVTLHGLAWGPEGDLYFAAGDPLLNYGDFARRPDHWGHWTVYSQPPGTKSPYTGQGGVFRCRPDGSRFQVVARGTRASDGLCFDESWNLFTNDNDHESLPARYVPARILHVTPQVDFAWPRGWMPEIAPERSDLLEIVYTGMGRGVPVAMAYYHELFLPERFRGTLLMPRWEQRAVTSYRLTPRGASFAGEELRMLEGDNRARPVGVVAGRGGRVFAAISYMAQNEGSPVYASDLVMITRADDEAPYAFEPFDPTTASVDALYQSLSSPSRSCRQSAHVELLRRGGEALGAAVSRLAAVAPDSAAFPHLVWLAGAAGGEEAACLLRSLASSDNATARWQAIRVLGEFAVLGAGREVFVVKLEDVDPRVQLAATVALFSRPGMTPGQLVEGPARSRDSYLRQTATRLLADQATLDELAELCSSSDAPTRLAGVLAAGFRLTIPAATAPLPAELPLNYYSENATFKIAYADGTIDLKSLDRVGSFTVAERWKALPHSPDDERLFEVLMARVDDADPSVRMQAAFFVDLLADDRAEGPVAAARRRTTSERLAAHSPVAINAAWVLGPLGELAADAPPRPESGPLDLRTQYTVGDAKLAWHKTDGDGQFVLTESTPAAGDYYVYFRLYTRTPQSVAIELNDGLTWRLWHNTNEVAVEGRSAAFQAQPGTNDVLLAVASPSSPALAVTVRSESEIVPSLAEMPAEGSLADRLRAAGQGGAASNEVPAELLAVDWPAAVKQGDWGRGRRLFGADGLGCTKCHAVGADARSGGAPSLEGVGRRLSVEGLVEAILAPSRQIAPVFRATTVETSAGQSFSGLIVAETADEIEMLMPDASRRKIAKSDVEARELTDVSPMPAGLIKSPGELADLLNFLTSDNPVPP